MDPYGYQQQGFGGKGGGKGDGGKGKPRGTCWTGMSCQNKDCKFTHLRDDGSSGQEEWCKRVGKTEASSQSAQSGNVITAVKEEQKPNEPEKTAAQGAELNYAGLKKEEACTYQVVETLDKGERLAKLNQKGIPNFRS